MSQPARAANLPNVHRSPSSETTSSKFEEKPSEGSPVQASSTNDHRYDLDLENQTTVQDHYRHLDDEPISASLIPTKTHTGEDLRPRPTRVKTLLGTQPQYDHHLSREKTGKDVIVDFDGPDDPLRPMNWPLRKKIVTTCLYGCTTMGATWASSIYAPAIPKIAEHFHVSTVVATLGVTLILLGYGLGPCIWGPVSELYGRKPAVMIPFAISICFTFGSATAKDFQTLMLTRFFTGVFLSAPITNSGGVLTDIWEPTERGNAMVAYASAIVVGPLVAPTVGAAIVNSYLGWRWTEYITGILCCLLLTLDLLILDETYPPVLLQRKAARLRFQTGNWALHCKHEEWDVSLREMFDRFGKKPFQILFTPICFFVAIYASFVYSLIYESFAAFPIMYDEERGWKPVVGTLPFLACLVGIVLGASINVYNNKYYKKKYLENNRRAVPEARLPPMMIGSFIFAAGLFLMGWTANKHIFWFPSIVGAALIGMGFFTIFQASLNYIVDTFSKYAASAVAAITFIRSILAAAFPLFTPAMYHNMGINWASTLLGCFALLLSPIPFILFRYGYSIRKKGEFSRGST